MLEFSKLQSYRRTYFLYQKFVIDYIARYFCISINPQISTKLSIMRIKSFIVTFITALLASGAVSSCASDEMDQMDQIIETESLSEDLQWANDDTTNFNTDLIGTISISIDPQNCEFSELYENESLSRSTNKDKSVKLNYKPKDSDHLYEAWFEVNGLEVKYKTPELNWFPTANGSYDLTFNTSQDGETSVCPLHANVDNKGGNQTLFICFRVTYTKNNVKTKYLIDFSACTDGINVIIRDRSRFE